MPALTPSTPGAPVVVMGVSGAGKSTVGQLLAERLGRPFVDADDLHPPANKAKMAAGIPLEDADRIPWLAVVGARLGERTVTGQFPIVACSALKRTYRDALREAAPEAVFIQLDGDPKTLSARLASRSHEFMPATLLTSQLTALEPLADDEPGLVVSISSPVHDIVESVATRLDRHEESV